MQYTYIYNLEVKRIYHRRTVFSLKTKHNSWYVIWEDTVMQSRAVVSESGGSSHFMKRFLIMANCAIDRSAVTCKWWMNLDMSFSQNPFEPKLYIAFVLLIYTCMGATIDNIRRWTKCGMKPFPLFVFAIAKFTPWPCRLEEYCHWLPPSTCMSICTSDYTSVCLFVWAYPRDNSGNILQILLITGILFLSKES